ncbi:MAG: CHC2 zinc finger domain-containing protein [Terriglobales bacterium]
MSKVQFLPNRWGRGLEQFKVPCQIFKDNVLTLNPCATKMLLFLYVRAQGKNQQLQHKGPQRELGIPLAISQKEFSERTGYGRNSLTAGAKELVAKGWLEPLPEKRARPKRGELCIHKYFLLDPETGERLPPVTGKPLVHVYFTVPACLVRKPEMRWSLAALSPPEATLYVTLLFRANVQWSNTFRNDAKLLRKMSRLGRGTAGPFAKAMDSLQDKGLIVADDNEISLCDPLTGEPVVASYNPANDPAHYFKSDGRRIVFNNGDPAARLKAVRDSLAPGEDLVEQSNGNFLMKCPFRAENDPSLSYKPSRGPGVFQCFGCKAKGTTRKLLMKLNGLDESKGIEHYSRALGIEPLFRPPYPNAEAFYSYTDEYQIPLYQVIRLPGKQFVVRHFTQGGWVYSLTGVTRTLYNRAGIFSCRNIVIVEGEKDADRVNGLDLRDDESLPIQATTSGDANSWKDRHAKLFERKNVTILPDADEPGRGYQEAIVKSLDSRNIPYRVLIFDGYKDVSEYLDGGPSRQDLENLIAEAWGWPTVDGRKTGEVILEGECSVWPKPLPNVYEFL